MVKYKFTFIDLFAGIGGLRIAAEKAGGKCIFTSEWNKYAQHTYMANFPNDNHLISGDITQIRTDEIPNHNLLVAGFPCQPFSIAGVSKKNSLGQQHGFESKTQGTLFFDIARIISEKKPEAFLLENVKNLISHNKGNTFKVIMNVLEDELGYQVFHKVLDAQHFLPQHRERIIIVGFSKESKFSWNHLDLPEKGRITMKQILEPEEEINPKYILSDKLWDYLQSYALKHKRKGNGFGYGLITENDICRTLSARYYKDGSEILVYRGAKRNPRRLTPRECARIMGFNDQFVIPVSDTQAYKQFGNSVAVPLFSHITQMIAPNIIMS